jgi:hypothetical protein
LLPPQFHVYCISDTISSWSEALQPKELFGLKLAVTHLCWPAGTDGLLTVTDGFAFLLLDPKLLLLLLLVLLLLPLPELPLLLLLYLLPLRVWLSPAAAALRLLPLNMVLLRMRV